MDISIFYIFLLPHSSRGRLGTSTDVTYQLILFFFPLLAPVQPNYGAGLSKLTQAVLQQITFSKFTELETGVSMLVDPQHGRGCVTVGES